MSDTCWNFELPVEPFIFYIFSSGRNVRRAVEFLKSLKSPVADWSVSSHVGQMQTFWGPDRISLMGPAVEMGNYTAQKQAAQCLVCQGAKTNTARGQKSQLALRGLVKWGRTLILMFTHNVHTYCIIICNKVDRKCPPDSTIRNKKDPIIHPVYKTVLSVFIMKAK